MALVEALVLLLCIKSVVSEGTSVYEKPCFFTKKGEISSGGLRSFSDILGEFIPFFTCINYLHSIVVFG